jgi:excisionase family DNA binding protein
MTSLLNGTPVEISSEGAAPKRRRARAPAYHGRPDCWTINDALRQLSISRATLYKMANNGEIRLARIGGRTLVPDIEIKRLVGEGA